MSPSRALLIRLQCAAVNRHICYRGSSLAFPCQRGTVQTKQRFIACVLTIRGSQAGLVSLEDVIQYCNIIFGTETAFHEAAMRTWQVIRFQPPHFFLAVPCMVLSVSLRCVSSRTSPFFRTLVLDLCWCFGPGSAIETYPPRLITHPRHGQGKHCN